MNVAKIEIFKSLQRCRRFAIKQTIIMAMLQNR